LDCIVSNERMMTENFELGKMQKEMIVLWLQVFFVRNIF
jgi:hypothetical protein